MKNKVYLKCVDLDYMGRGICYKDDKTYFVSNMLPCEEGNVLINKEKNNLCFGILKNFEIINKSPNRSRYDYNDINNLVHLTPRYQLEFQENLTKKTLDKFKVKYDKINPILFNDNIYHYRNKSNYKVINSLYINLGNFYNNSNNHTIFSNIIVSKTINELVLLLNEKFKEEKIFDSNLEEITFRINENNQIMVLLHLKDIKNISYKKYIDIILKNDNYKIISIYIVSNYVYKHIYGEKFIKYNINNIKYYLLANSFLQVNTSMIKPMYDLIKRNVSENDIILDAFSGISSISVYLSDKIIKSYSIEIDRSSNEAAKKTIKSNNINNIEFINQNFFTSYNKYYDKINTIVFDPPRTGLNKNVIKTLDRYPNIRKIIYLSCNLKTLSRDLKMLEQYYLISEIYPIKNFYNTCECETLVILKRKK